MNDLALNSHQGASGAALLSFVIYLVGVFVLAGLANRVRSRTSFASEYFLGGRNIGLWAFALTYAATAASGGSFMGFPALIYTSGWSLAIWIGGYVMVPLVALGLLAKRINQVGRIAGAITIPELLLKRFGSRSVGNVATILLVFFMFFYLLAQFKAGAEIMATLLEDSSAYQKAVVALESVTQHIPWVRNAHGDYLLCLIVFATAVIVYTSYGGFRAVVWTDVMQGLVMAVGVILMLGLTLNQVGGLKKATQALAKMTPPEFGQARLVWSEIGPDRLPRGSWLMAEDGRVVRLKDAATRPSGLESAEAEILILTTPEEQERMAQAAIPGVQAQILETTPYAYGAGQLGVYISAPGPSRNRPEGFITVMLALSFFAFWNFAAVGQPSYMVRQMAYNNTVTLRRSMMLVTVFFSLIYFPLLLIFTSARVLLPGMEIHPDRIMPEMATHLTSVAGVPWLAGLLVAAPFAAVMSSVDSYLLLVSSGVVRDIYQQNIHPDAPEARIKKLCYIVTAVLGFLAVLAVLNPPRFLQDLIVFASGGLGASFLMPMAFALYWPRMTAGGAIAGMISGSLTILTLYTVGYLKSGQFGEYNLLGFHPFLWAMAITALVIVGTSLRGQPPEGNLLKRFFGAPSGQADQNR